MSEIGYLSVVQCVQTIWSGSEIGIFEFCLVKFVERTVVAREFVHVLPFPAF